MWFSFSNLNSQILFPLDVLFQVSSNFCNLLLSFDPSHYVWNQYVVNAMNVIRYHLLRENKKKEIVFHVDTGFLQHFRFLL